MSAVENKTMIFEEMKAILKPYAKLFNEQKNTKTHYGLTLNKEVEVSGRQLKDVAFIDVIIQKTYVGLYFMPIYAEPELKKIIPERLKPCLKGKSCFHLKSWNDSLKSDLEVLFQLGLKSYQEKQWT